MQAQDHPPELAHRVQRRAHSPALARAVAVARVGREVSTRRGRVAGAGEHGTRSVRLVATSSNTSASSLVILRLNAFFFSGRFIVTVTTPWSSRVTSSVSKSASGMGVPYRRGLQPVPDARVKHQGDVLIVAAALLVVAALVAWAVFGT